METSALWFHIKASVYDLLMTVIHGPSVLGHGQMTTFISGADRQVILKKVQRGPGFFYFCIFCKSQKLLGFDLYLITCIVQRNKYGNFGNVFRSMTASLHFITGFGSSERKPGNQNGTKGLAFILPATFHVRNLN